MLLRRITEHVKSQNWFAVLLDFLIVVVGIYLGLQASAWQESRQDQRRGLETLERLHADFQVINGEIDEALSYHRGIVDGMVAVLSATATGELATEDEERFVYGLDSALKYSAGSRRSSTYVDIVSSGQTYLISDPDLRAALSHYDELHQKAPNLFAQFWEGQRLHEVAFSRHFELAASRELRGEIFMPGTVARYDVDAMAADPEFVLAAQRLTEYQTYYQIWHLQMQQAADEVSSMLASVLSD